MGFDMLVSTTAGPVGFFQIWQIGRHLLRTVSCEGFTLVFIASLPEASIIG